MPSWALQAEYFQACSCDYGCPCEFAAPPTMGFCEGIGAWRILHGHYDKVVLNGLALGFVAKWPEAIHKGNGTLAFFVDERASSAQREALVNIATGQAGGMPFSIIITTMTKVIGPHFVSFVFDSKGRNSSARIGDSIRMHFSPITNPVTGEPEGIRIEHETGFVFKSAEVVNSKVCESTLPELPFSYPNKAGFVTMVEYHD